MCENAALSSIADIWTTTAQAVEQVDHWLQDWQFNHRMPKCPWVDTEPEVAPSSRQAPSMAASIIGGWMRSIVKLSGHH